MRFLKTVPIYIAGTATILAVAIMSIPQLDLQDLSRALEWVFLILLPNYCLGQGLEDYYSNYEFKDIYVEYCVKKNLRDKTTCEFIPNFCCAGIVDLFLLYPLQTVFVGGYTVFMLSVRPSVPP